MSWLGKISPQLSFSVGTGLREVAFPLRPPVAHPPPKLRDDFRVYADLFRQATNNFSKTVSPFHPEFKWSRGRVFNNFFESVDAELYYSMIRFFQPSQVIEIGAGNSTWFARDALRANGGGTLLAIDPSSRLALPRECQVEKRLLQEIDLSLFRNLTENDILFIDASHTTTEAVYETEKIYPALRPGVFIHHHDIPFPDVPYSFVVRHLTESLEEQTVILDFLRSHTESFEVFTSSSFVSYESPDLLQRLVPSHKYAVRKTQSSLWIRKMGN